MELPYKLHHRRSMQKNSPFPLLLAPALAVTGLLFFGGMVSGVLRSFNYMPVIGLDAPSLDAYARVLASPEFYRSLAVSLYIAITATVISSALALGVALLLRGTFAGRGVTLFLFQLNLTIPHIVGALGIFYLISQSGSFARIAGAAGAITSPSDFPALVYDPFSIGIIVQYVWKETPFTALMLLASLQAIGADHEQAARTLGASRLQSIRHVVLPAISPSLTWASMIVFAFTFGAFEVPLLLGASQPQALSVLAYRKYADVDLAARPDAMVIALLMATFCAALLIMYRSMIRRPT